MPAARTTIRRALSGRSIASRGGRKVDDHARTVTLQARRLDHSSRFLSTGRMSRNTHPSARQRALGSTTHSTTISPLDFTGSIRWNAVILSPSVCAMRRWLHLRLKGKLVSRKPRLSVALILAVCLLVWAPLTVATADSDDEGLLVRKQSSLVPPSSCAAPLGSALALALHFSSDFGAPRWLT